MDEELIDKSIETGELQLTTKEKRVHYRRLLFPGVLIAASILMPFIDFLNGNHRPLSLMDIFFTVVTLTIAYLMYRTQKGRLRLTEVQSNLKRDKIIEIIKRTGDLLNWEIERIEDKIVFAETMRFIGFPKTPIGEQITLLFDGDRILINSISNLRFFDKQGILSKDFNKENVETLVHAIEDASGVVREKPVVDVRILE